MWKYQRNAGRQEDSYREKRLEMVEKQIRRRGVQDKRVLAVMEKVPRHRFIPSRYLDRAYADEPLPIGNNQTVSQPFIVAYMLSQLQLKPDDRVLEIGTGSGYQTALLAELVRQVYTIEIYADLSSQAQIRLNQFHYHNIFFKVGDGYSGWPEEAPFDAITVSAAPPEFPAVLAEQLAQNRRMVVPVGVEQQELFVVTRLEDRLEKMYKIPVRFVPMVRGPGSGTGTL